MEEIISTQSTVTVSPERVTKWTTKEWCCGVEKLANGYSNRTPPAEWGNVAAQCEAARKDIHKGLNVTKAFVRSGLGKRRLALQERGSAEVMLKIVSTTVVDKVMRSLRAHSDPRTGCRVVVINVSRGRHAAVGGAG